MMTMKPSLLIASIFALFLSTSFVQALVFRSYSSTRHDRFVDVGASRTLNPNAFYDSSLYTGVGYGFGFPNERQYVLVTPQHVLFANHNTYFHPGSTINFVNASGQVITRVTTAVTNVPNGAGGSSDVVIMKLNAPLLPADGITPLPYLNLASESAYNNMVLTTFGQKLGAGRTQISSFTDYSSSSIAKTRSIRCNYNSTGNADDAYVESGDSGSPSFGIVNGKPALVGLHLAVSASTHRTTDSFVPQYVPAINGLLLADGYQLTAAYPNAVTYNYDLGPFGSPVMTGSTPITPTETGYISWTGAPVSGVDRNPGGGINDMNRDLIYGSGVSQLNHKIANGVWSININMGDPSYAHDQMEVRAEGILIGNNINSAASAFPYVTGQVTVTDGELNLEFSDNGGADANWAVTRLSLTWVRALRPPVANSASVSATSGIPLPITLTGSDPDGDTITFHVDTPPAHGTLSGTPPNLSYTPALDYVGPDSFTFITRDASLDSSPATISIAITNPDSDGDGLSDGFEYVHYGHPTDNTDGTGDLDGDGVDDRSEVAAGTDPEDPASLFRLTADGFQTTKIEDDTTSVTLKWYSQLGRTYKIWKSTTMKQGEWSMEQTGVPAATGSTTTSVVIVSGDQYYFRVSIDP